MVCVGEVFSLLKCMSSMTKNELFIASQGTVLKLFWLSAEKQHQKFNYSNASNMFKLLNYAMFRILHT